MRVIGMEHKPTKAKEPKKDENKEKVEEPRKNFKKEEK